MPRCLILYLVVFCQGGRKTQICTPTTEPISGLSPVAPGVFLEESYQTVCDPLSKKDRNAEYG